MLGQRYAGKTPKGYGGKCNGRELGPGTCNLRGGAAAVCKVTAAASATATTHPNLLLSFSLKLGRDGRPVALAGHGPWPVTARLALSDGKRGAQRGELLEGRTLRCHCWPVRLSVSLTPLTTTIAFVLGAT